MKWKFFNPKHFLVGIVLILSLFITACADEKSDKIIVGGKAYTEQDVLVHLVSELIESETDLEVERKPFLGGTNVVFNALRAGDIDFSVDYTGTAYSSILEETGLEDENEIYEEVKKQYSEQFGIEWLEPLGFNNTYALAMPEERAEELGIEKISDLGKYSEDFKIASDDEFLERDDGLYIMTEAYDLKFKQTIGMDPGLMYRAVAENEVDVIAAFSTDGRIPGFNLRLLEDDKNIFFPYYAAINAKEETLKAHPELRDLLNQLANKLTNEEMAKLNAEVDIEGKSSEKTAKDWLINQNLIK